MAAIVNHPSFARFIYPFRFDATAFNDRSTRIDAARWPDEPTAITVWERLKFPTGMMLPHIADYLNAEHSDATVRLWKLTDAAWTRRRGFWRDLPWELRCDQKIPWTVPFQWAGAELALFRTGIGFLTIDARPEWKIDVGNWLRFIQSFRFAGGQRSLSIGAWQRQGRDQRTPFFPEPVASVGDLGHGGHLRHLIEAMLRFDEMARTVPVWWEHLFVPWQLLPFAALYVDGALPADIPHLLYRTRHFFSQEQGLHPALEDVQIAGNVAYLPYAERQWFTFSLDGGAFVACDAPQDDEPGGGFVRGTLADHLAGEYSLIMLLALHQRFAMMELSARVARDWLPAHRDGLDTQIDALRTTREGLLEFTARGYFAQVMQSEHHHRVYRRWQETYQIDRIYHEVSNEIAEMHQYVEARRAQNIERQERESARFVQLAQERVQRLELLITILAAVFAGPSLALAYLSATGPVSRCTAFRWSIASLVIGIAVVSLVHLLVSRWHVVRRPLRYIVARGWRRNGHN